MMPEAQDSMIEQQPQYPIREKSPNYKVWNVWRKITRLAPIIPAATLLSAVMSACSDAEQKIATPTPEVHQPVTTQTITAIPSETETPLIQTTPTVPEPETSPTPQAETAPPKPLLEFEDGIDQQTQDYILSITEELPPLGNTRIQFTKLDKEAFWPNKDGVPTLEVGVAGFTWQLNFFHGLGHAYDPSLNPEIVKLQTPEQNSHLKQAIETALTDPLWGEALAPDKLYSPVKDLASTHPEMRGKVIDEETLNAELRLRADGAYIGRSSEFIKELKADFIFGPEFLDPTLIEQFAQKAPEYTGTGSIPELVTKYSNFLDQLAASNPFWKLAVADIRKYATAFDNYEWSETLISLPRPLKFNDQRSLRALLTFADIALRYRFLQKDQELLGLLSIEQQSGINIKLDERISAYRRELLAGGLGIVLMYENWHTGALEFEGVDFGAKVPVEEIKATLQKTPYYQVYRVLFPTAE